LKDSSTHFCAFYDPGLCPLLTGLFDKLSATPERELKKLASQARTASGHWTGYLPPNHVEARCSGPFLLAV